MTKRTVELIIEVATEVFAWAVGIFKEKSEERRKERNDSSGNPETK